MSPIINIQFLRAMAATAVLIYHFSLQYLAITQGELNYFFQLFNLIGYAGVDFFFVISGYIMWITTRQAATQQPVAQFAFKRLTRIYLGYWPYYFIAVLLISAYPQIAPKGANLLGSFLLSEPLTQQLLIQVAWTLQFELYFYLLFALVLLLPSKQHIHVILAMSLVVVSYQFLNTGTPVEDFNLLNFFLSPFCLQFFAGCLLGFYFENHRVKIKWLFVLGCLLLVFAVYYQANVLNHSLIDNTYIIRRVALYGSAAILIMAALIELEKRSIQLFRRLSVTLGNASYSIYLSHTLAIALIYALGWQTWVQQNSQSPGWWIGLFMMLTIIYSVAHYLWVEKPIMSLANMLRKKLFR